MGFYDSAIGLAGFAASTAGGLLWTAVGPWATFAYGGGCACAAAAFLLVAHTRRGRSSRPQTPGRPVDVTVATARAAATVSTRCSMTMKTAGL